jgi:hypothetical protein
VESHVVDLPLESSRDRLCFQAARRSLEPAALVLLVAELCRLRKCAKPDALLTHINELLCHLLADDHVRGYCLLHTDALNSAFRRKPPSSALITVAHVLHYEKSSWVIGEVEKMDPLIRLKEEFARLDKWTLCFCAAELKLICDEWDKASEEAQFLLAATLVLEKLRQDAWAVPEGKPLAPLLLSLPSKVVSLLANNIPFSFKYPIQSAFSCNIALLPKPLGS